MNAESQTASWTCDFKHLAVGTLVALPPSMRNPDLDTRIDDAALAIGIDLTVDPDDLHLAQAASMATDGTIYSALAVALDSAMLRDDAAMARYREIWGQDYTGVDPLARSARTLRRSPRIAVGTAPGTVVGTARGQR